MPGTDQEFLPQNFGFDFAFGLNDLLDPSIGYFTVKYVDVVPGSSIIVDPIEKSTYINYTMCGENLFNYDNQEEIDFFGIN